MDPLEAYGCSELRPLVENGTLDIMNGHLNATVPWETLCLDIVPMRHKSRRGAVTYEVNVLRDADVAEEQAGQYGPGEGPNRKFTVEKDSEDYGAQFVEDFDDADELIAWIETGIEEFR
jgi:hypothetical protein